MKAGHFVHGREHVEIEVFVAIAYDLVMIQIRFHSNIYSY